MIISDSAAKLAKIYNINCSEEEGLKDNTFISEKDIQEYVIKTKRNNIIVIGGGGHAKMCIDIINQTNIYKIYGIIDNNMQIGQDVLGVKVIGNDNNLEQIFSYSGVKLAINAVGGGTNTKIREKIFNKLKDIGFYFPNIIHPKAIIEPSSTLGEGNQIMMGAMVGSDAKIKDNCIINSGSIVSHDCEINNNVHIAPGAILAGGVVVGENSLIGMGTTVFFKVKIANDVTIKNGTNVFFNINQ